MNWFRKLLGKPAGKGSAERVVPVATIQITPDDGPIGLHQDQVLRKAWAEGLLVDQGVPINLHLPCIESEAAAKLRPAREIADRLLALAIVAVKGEGLEDDRVHEIIKGRQARALFTPHELAFIDDPAPSDHDRLQFSWRYEAAWVMFWALNFTGESLAYPSDVCDVPRLVETVRDTPNLAKHGARSANDLLNEADLIYRYHWAVRQAGLDGVPPPAKLDPGVVMERHHALNWLIGYGGTDWDDVSTDT